MVEVIDDWLYDLLDVTEIHYPAEVFVKGACDMDGEPVRVSVQAGALMAFGYVWQAVGCFEIELAEDFHAVAHGIPRYLWVCRLSCHLGCSRQYSTALAVFATALSLSIGCRRKFLKFRCS